MPRSIASRLGLGAMTLLIGLGPATAQQPPATPAVPSAPAASVVPPPSPSEMQVARDLVQANGEAHAFDGVVTNILQGAALAFLQSNPDLAPQLRDVAIAIQPEFQKRQSEIIDILALAYADRFTEAELREALTFFKSATGQKLVQDRPAIVQQAVAAMQQWGARVNSEAMDRIRAEMKKKGYDL